ncbi:hypothetical protein K439DRAFT_1642290 [Ramaria rubella]|nr:hypothetical protein K439DRAFT_1642290 [Ramaria rubella]
MRAVVISRCVPCKEKPIDPTMNSTLVFPSGAACFVNSLQAGNLASPCPVTNDMLQFLNLTTAFKYYFNAYCLNPPQDDGCPYGYCPNSDIAGLLVRVSAYLTNFFVAILVFYQPEELKESFWSQLLSVYSLLLTCTWTIIRHHLTRIHAILTLVTAGSPLTLGIFAYAVRSIWEGNHRLSPAVGRGKIIPRTIVLAALAIWFALWIYIVLPSHLSDFQQESCEPHSHIVKYFYALPLLIVIDMPTWSQCLTAIPIPLTMLAWIVVIIMRRHEIWPRGEVFRPRFRTIWRMIKEHYPFIQFVTVVAIPTAYWVATIETGVIAARTNDDHVSASFGQVLAMFVAVPPLLSVAKLGPRLLNWFVDLAWVRFISGRPQRQDTAPQPGFPVTLTSSSAESGFDYEKKPAFPSDVWSLRSFAPIVD